MKIRKEQIQSFDEVRLPDFVDEMVGHLKEFTPLHSQSLGEDGVRHLIGVSIARAKRHEVTHRAAVRFYLETVILFGIDFDTDPQITLDPNQPSEDAVISTLAHEMGHAQYTQRTITPNGLTKDEFVKEKTQAQLEDEGDATLTQAQYKSA
jgi:hypothetical protein